MSLHKVMCAIGLHRYRFVYRGFSNPSTTWRDGKIFKLNLDTTFYFYKRRCKWCGKESA